MSVRSGECSVCGEWVEVDLPDACPKCRTILRSRCAMCGALHPHEPWTAAGCSSCGERYDS